MPFTIRHISSHSFTRVSCVTVTSTLYGACVASLNTPFAGGLAAAAPLLAGLFALVAPRRRWALLGHSLGAFVLLAVGQNSLWIERTGTFVQTLHLSHRACCVQGDGSEDAKEGHGALWRAERVRTSGYDSNERRRSFSSTPSNLVFLSFSSCFSSPSSSSSPHPRPLPSSSDSPWLLSSFSSQTFSSSSWSRI